MFAWLHRGKKEQFDFEELEPSTCEFAHGLRMNLRQKKKRVRDTQIGTKERDVRIHTHTHMHTLTPMPMRLCTKGRN